jgi:hypothetical protein
MPRFPEDFPAPDGLGTIVRSHAKLHGFFNQVDDSIPLRGSQEMFFTKLYDLRCQCINVVMLVIFYEPLQVPDTVYESARGFPLGMIKDL